MAATEESFRSFVARRKLEYSNKFPFLKESQIVAKLRRIWTSQKPSTSLLGNTGCDLSTRSSKSSCSTVGKKPNGKGFTSRKCCASQESNCKAGQFDKENVVPAVDIDSLKPKATALVHSHNKKLSSKSPPKLCPPRTNAILKLAQQPPTSFLTPQSEGNSSCAANPFPHNPSESTLTPHPEQLKLATPESLPQPTRRLPRPTISPPLEAAPTAQDETADLLQEAPSLEERNPGTPGQGNVEEVVVTNLDSIRKPTPKLVSWKSLQVLHSPEKPWSPTLAQTETVKQSGQWDHRALDAESEKYEAPGNLDSICNSTYEDSLTLEEEHLLKESLEACMPSLSPVLRSLPSLHSATPNVDKLLRRKVHSRRLHDRQLMLHSVITEPKCELREEALLPVASRRTQSGLDCGGQQKLQTGNINKVTVSSDPEVAGLVAHRKTGLKGDDYFNTPGKSFSIENVNMEDSSKLENERIQEVPGCQGSTQTTPISITEGIAGDGTITSQECVSTSVKAKPVRRRRKRGRPQQPSSPNVRQNNVYSASTYSQPDMTVGSAQLRCEPSVSDSAGFEAVQNKDTKDVSSKNPTQKVSRKRRRKADTEKYLPVRVTRRTAALQKALLEECLGKATADPLPAAKRQRPSSTVPANFTDCDVPWEEKSEGTVENTAMQDEECMQKPGERPTTTTMNANGSAEASAEASADATVPSEYTTGTPLRNVVQAVPGEREHSTVTKTSLSPVQQNLMCDLFLFMTPDHQTYGCFQDQSSSNTKRRVFRSAPSEGESNFHTMFTDESDIFM